MHIVYKHINFGIRFIWATSAAACDTCTSFVIQNVTDSYSTGATDALNYRVAGLHDQLISR